LRYIGSMNEALQLRCGAARGFPDLFHSWKYC
jgi:hypothetical protein